MLSSRFDEIPRLTDRDPRALCPDVQKSVVCVVFDGEQPPEIARHTLSVRDHRGQDLGRLSMVLPTRAHSQFRAADGIGGGDTSQDRKGCRYGRARYLIRFGTDELGHGEERAGMLKPGPRVGAIAWLGSWQVHEPSRWVGSPPD